MGGFILPNISISKIHPFTLQFPKWVGLSIHPNISISKIHPFTLQFPKWVGLFIQTSPSPKGGLVHSLQCLGGYEKMLQTPHRLSNQIYTHLTNGGRVPHFFFWKN
jgi:hypothetical protein